MMFAITVAYIKARSGAAAGSMMIAITGALAVRAGTRRAAATAGQEVDARPKKLFHHRLYQGREWGLRLG